LETPLRHNDKQGRWLQVGVSCFLNRGQSGFKKGASCLWVASMLLRVVDRETALLGRNISSSAVQRLFVLLKLETEVRTANKQQAADHNCAIRGAKTRIIGSFKSSQCAPRPVFLRVCRHVTRNQHFRSKCFAPQSWWSCSATASGSPAARAGARGHIPPPPLTSFERF
jgi:hypothetical protein